VLTIGGGVVVENTPPQRVKNVAGYADFLAVLTRESKLDGLRARVTASGTKGLAIAEAVARTGWPPQQIISASSTIPEIVRVGDIFVSKPALDLVRTNIVSVLDRFHQTNALVSGMSQEELRGRFSEVAPEVFARVFEEAVRAKQIEAAGELVRLSGRGVVMKDDEAESKKIIEAAFANAGLKVPALKDVLAGLNLDKARAQKIVTLLLRDKVLVKISEDLVFHRDALVELRQRMATEKSKSPKLDVARFKDLTGATRKYAIPLLEYLDREHVTRRMGDQRIIL
jgi:selenocysteine-specific elongation factor